MENKRPPGGSGVAGEPSPVFSRTFSVAAPSKEEHGGGAKDDRGTEDGGAFGSQGRGRSCF